MTLGLGALVEVEVVEPLVHLLLQLPEVQLETNLPVLTLVVAKLLQELYLFLPVTSRPVWRL